MGQFFPAFKAYDIRGVVPTELNPDLAYRVGRAFADQFDAKTVCIGYDIRLSGPELYDAFARGLNEGGVDVVHLGMVGTEMVYFATAFYGYDGGCMITASHNPPEYNGLKMVRAESQPISGDSGLNDIERRAHEQKWEKSGNGKRIDKNVYADFVEHLIKVVDPAQLKPLKILADVGNGAAGVALRELAPKIPLQLTERLWEPDGTFPNGVPNPILEESRAPTEEAMRAGDFDFGVAWDGDYDRCFFFDEHGTFIEGYYIVGLLASVFLKRNPGAKIVHDPRLTWNTIDIVKSHGGTPVLCKSGHAFIKAVMREVDAVYGGEMSAHHYFRDFAYCDSGMVPWLVLAQVLSDTGLTLSSLVGERMRMYPASGEINRRVPDGPGAIAAVEAKYAPGALSVDYTDGLSIEFATWRLNLRSSNTEPLIRLNVESRGDQALMEAKTAELLGFLGSLGAVAADH